MYRLTKGGKILRHIIIWLAIFFVVFPVIWIFAASINPVNTLASQRLIPKMADLSNYADLFTNEQHPVMLWMFNSIKISGITALLSVLLTALGAYAFSRFRFTGRKAGLFMFLLVQVFPQTCAMVALYALILAIGKYAPWLGLNTHAGLIMIYLGGALGINTWLMKGYFDSIPKALDEAAMVDGASHSYTFFHIILPLAKPMLAVIFILSFIGTYGEYLLASIFLTGTKSYTLTVGLNLLVSGSFSTEWGVFAAGAILGSLPILIMFFALQDLLISGLTMGSVKG